MLFTPTAHEPLTAAAWDEKRVRAAIRAIVQDAEAAVDLDAGWPSHPRDSDGREVFRTLYLGAAGVVSALHALQGRGLVELERDYVPLLERLLEAERTAPELAEHDPPRSLLMGECGILLVLHLLRPTPELPARLAELIAANAQDPRRELMWGSPGSMLVARRLGLDELWRESARWLWEQWARRRVSGRRSCTGGCSAISGPCTDSPGTCSR